MWQWQDSRFMFTCLGGDCYVYHLMMDNEGIARRKAEIVYS